MQLIERVSERLDDGPFEFWTSASNIPAVPGAYILAVEVARPVKTRLRNRAPELLPAGRYLYCGSAKGPGGLRARIARHMRRGKAIRWHIDMLTEAGRVLGAWTVVEGEECELVAALQLPIAVEGFGNSDCQICKSHLLRWPMTVSTSRHAIGFLRMAEGTD